MLQEPEEEGLLIGRPAYVHAESGVPKAPSLRWRAGVRPPCLTAFSGVMVGLMLVLPATTPVHASDADPWFGHDKALHFSASAVIAAGGYGVARAAFDDRRPCLLFGGGLALAAGAGKELYDLSGHGDASLRDLTWDAIGTATGLLVAWSVDRLLQHWLQPRTPAPAAP